MGIARLPPTMVEMLRSLVTLGQSQNLSFTTSELGVSRQTVRRHINQLEQLRGQTLFEVGNRQYRLTEDGKAAVSAAETLLSHIELWASGQAIGSVNLTNTEIEVDETSWMYAQQHPLIKLWSLAPPILKEGARAWSVANGSMEHPAFAKVRQYMLVLRKFQDEWLLVEIGEKSAYATWLGVPMAKSELGRKLDLGAKYDPMLTYWRRPYEAVLVNGGFWYEHISTSLPRHVGEQPVPVNYQRLVVACTFADGGRAIMVFAARTDRIEIPNMPKDRFLENKPENLMEFEI